MSGPISASPFPFDPGPLGFSAFESLKREAVDIRQRGLREIDTPQTGSISERRVHLCGSPGLFGGFPFPLARRGVFSFGLCVRERWRGGGFGSGHGRAPWRTPSPCPRGEHKARCPGSERRHNGNAPAPTAAVRGDISKESWEKQSKNKRSNETASLNKKLCDEFGTAQAIIGRGVAFWKMHKGRVETSGGDALFLY